MPRYRSELLLLCHQNAERPPRLHSWPFSHCFICFFWDVVPGCSSWMKVHQYASILDKIIMICRISHIWHYLTISDTLGASWCIVVHRGASWCQMSLHSWFLSPRPQAERPRQCKRDADVLSCFVQRLQLTLRRKLRQESQETSETFNFHQKAIAVLCRSSMSGPPQQKEVKKLQYLI